MTAGLFDSLPGLKCSAPWCMVALSGSQALTRSRRDPESKGAVHEGK
jgi:hypothetical protein